MIQGEFLSKAPRDTGRTVPERQSLESVAYLLLYDAGTSLFTSSYANFRNNILSSKRISQLFSKVSQNSLSTIKTWPTYVSIYWAYHNLLGFPGGSELKASACNSGDPGSIPGWGRSPGEGHGNHSSILAWRIPWREEPGRLQRVTKSRT